jgi:proteasome accessory factor A
MNEHAVALKVGTTALVLDLLEDGIVPKRVGLMDPVQGTRDISRDETWRWVVRLENGQTRSALEIQHAFLSLAKTYLAGMTDEGDWIIEAWQNVLEGIERDPMSQIHTIDWVAKRWLLESFMKEEHVGWNDPWLQSLDLEYHNLDPSRGLYLALVEQGIVKPAVGADRVRHCIEYPPSNTRAEARGTAVRFLKGQSSNYIINWDSVAVEGKDPLVMGNPFHTYRDEIVKLLSDTPGPAKRA